MNADWMTTPAGQRVQQHVADSRPAWLWSVDGQSLLWSNPAARFFLAKYKKHGLKLAPPAVPIKGQLARIARLGSVGRTSLSRVQFLAGDKPASGTCACTPLDWGDGQVAVLIVGVDPIAPELLNQGEQEPVADVGDVAAEAPIAAVLIPEPMAESPALEELDGPASVADEPVMATGNTADQADVVAQELDAEPELAEGSPEHSAHDAAVAETDDVRLVDALRGRSEVEVAGFNSSSEEPVADRALVEEAAPVSPPTEAAVQPSADAPQPTRLSGLFDRMANNPDLFTPLTDADDVIMADPIADESEQAPAPTLFKIIGRGFTPIAAPQTDAERDLSDLAQFDAADEVEGDLSGAEAPTLSLDDRDALAELQQERLDDDGDPLPELVVAELPAAEPADTAEPTIDSDQPSAAPDAEAVERVSRYNFDELSRILNDRVGDVGQPSTGSSLTPVLANTGALINLGGETLVLNRLPLGILVFRDQQVLFANRAITEMVGYESVERLRAAGLAAIFPAMGPDGQEAGPVNHLVQRDGALVPVTARLQSISWQGRPALMLSASATEVRTGHEEAVRAFAQAFAEVRHDGYFETNRSGTISLNNGEASTLLGGGPGDLVGRALINFIDVLDQPEFRKFLERPARFAETARPAMTLAGNRAGVELQIFAQGQAGIVSGYFGFVHRSDSQRPPAQLTSGEPEPALLSRISRGVRRPLNTIIGFSDLIRSEAFGALKNERYEAYADDIRTAGHEIAALVDELDDYARLKDGRYLPQRASIELGPLLESCVLRVRQQANAARVIVRSAISEKLPRITADRASLAQAVLNLLASAIDQTPAGGAVVISAQTEDDGAIAIHVRDSATTNVDMAERFVVFRDGVGRDGQALTPVRSSVGLALTRSLLAVNAFSLSVDPAGEQGMLFSLLIPADLVDYPPQH